MDGEQLKTYALTIEQAVGQTFLAEKIPVHLPGTIQGPHTITVAVRLYQRTASNFSKALRSTMVSALEAACNVSPIRVYMDQGIIFCEIPSPSPVTVNGTMLRGDRLTIPLGVTPRRAVAGVDFVPYPMLACVGPTRRGKTTAMRAIAFHLARQNSTDDVAFIAATFRPKEWAAFRRLAHCWNVIIDPGETQAMLQWLYGEVLRRAGTETKPEIFAFVDDVFNLLDVVDVGKELGKIASLGGGSGVHLILGSQSLGEKGIGAAIVGRNMPTKLILGAASASDAAYFAGRGKTGAESLGSHIGDAVLITDGGVTRLAVGYVSDADLARLPHNSATYRPWAKDMSGAPVHQFSDTPKSAENAPSVSGAPVHQLLKRQPTEEDARQLRAIYARVGSKNQVYAACEVAKNPLRAAWLDQALGA